MRTKTRPVVAESLEGRQLFSTTIAVFDDPKFVNTSAGSDTKDLIEQLQSYGKYTVKTFTGTDAASFANGLATANLLLIPALDKGDLSAATTNATKTIVRNYLTSGGGLLFAGDPNATAISFLNSTFAYNLGYDRIGAGSYYTMLNGAAGTKFESGSSVLQNNVNVYGIDGNSSFNPGIPVYAGNVSITVELLPFAGRNPIEFLGYDWTDGGPNGTQDGGWNQILDLGIQQVAGKPPVTPVTPAPTSLKATALNQTTINLTWNGSSSGVTGYVVQRAVSAAGPWTQVGTTAVGVTAFSSIGLKAGISYFYRVYATGPAGNSTYSNILSATTFSNNFATLTNGVLAVNGTNDNDRIFLTLSGTTLTITENALKQTFSVAAVHSITITEGNGNDLVAIGKGVGATKVAGGAGNDTFVDENAAIDTFIGGIGNDVLIGKVTDVVSKIKTIVT